MTNAITEQPVLFDGLESHMAGVLCRPAEPTDTAVLICWRGGSFPSSDKNRMRRRMAHEFARLGVAALRFDLSGVGESGGEEVTPTIENPDARDVVSAAEFLHEQGFHNLIVVGNCFGAWSAMHAAPRLGGLVGLVAANPPVRSDHMAAQARDADLSWWLERIRKIRPSKLLDPGRLHRARVSVQAKASSVASRRPNIALIERLDYLAERGIHVLLLLGRGDFRPDYDRFAEEIAASVARVPKPAGLIDASERLTGLDTVSVQDWLIRVAVDFVSEVLAHHPELRLTPPD